MLMVDSDGSPKRAFWRLLQGLSPIRASWAPGASMNVYVQRLIDELSARQEASDPWTSAAPIASHISRARRDSSVLDRGMTDTLTVARSYQSSFIIPHICVALQLQDVELVKVCQDVARSRGWDTWENSDFNSAVKQLLQEIPPGGNRLPEKVERILHFVADMVLGRNSRLELYQACLEAPPPAGPFLDMASAFASGPEIYYGHHRFKHAIYAVQLDVLETLTPPIFVEDPARLAHFDKVASHVWPSGLQRSAKGALEGAIKGGHALLARHILRTCFSPASVRKPPFSRLLQLAVWRSEETMVEMMVEDFGWAVDGLRRGKGIVKETSLLGMVAKGDEEMARYLLGVGVSPWPALLPAANRDDLAVLRALLLSEEHPIDKWVGPSAAPECVADAQKWYREVVEKEACGAGKQRTATLEILFAVGAAHPALRDIAAGAVDACVRAAPSAGSGMLTRSKRVAKLWAAALAAAEEEMCFCCNTEDQEGLNSSVCISKREFSKEDTGYAAYLNEYVLQDPTLPRANTIKCANPECSKKPDEPNSVAYIKYDPVNLRNYDPSKYQSAPRLTPFERASVKGMRLEQLSHGAPTVLTDEEVEGLKDVSAVMEKEFALRKIPLMVLRTLPNQEKELWRFEDLVDLSRR
ncbi:hypothetical protein HXX76_014081 [Chlamydomonas incerta]|uniref:Uncharacterized protein n=1 Tax=Chlamydomonas incerta TaxID=51695 RepID=A0A835SK30_CHLIN|nr:hypothetical protein HXX76_014081 [Chlamydomonas incerta]|eukprot:KAG2424923.1 hypothetical protein HXX76_014081 [Chlamydomonas incerta]